VWSEAFSLVLQIQPLAFGPVLPTPLAPPRELVCDVRDLGRPVFIHPMRVPNLPRFATAGPAKTYLIGPRSDAALSFAAMILASASGGAIDLRPPEVKQLEKIHH
jgi:hypothetical protein